MVLRRVAMPQQPLNIEPTSSSQILPVPDPIPSYWLSAPSPHANLRSTPELPEQCDIAIIGTGMSGVLTAYHILQNSSALSLKQDKSDVATKVPKIVILDARQLCSGATARNGGHAKVKTATLADLADDEARNEFQGYVLGVMGELKRLVDDEGIAEVCLCIHCFSSNVGSATVT